MLIVNGFWMLSRLISHPLCRIRLCNNLFNICHIQIILSGGPQYQGSFRSFQRMILFVAGALLNQLWLNSGLPIFPSKSIFFWTPYLDSILHYFCDCILAQRMREFAVSVLGLPVRSNQQFWQRFASCSNHRDLIIWIIPAIICWLL